MTMSQSLPEAATNHPNSLASRLEEALNKENTAKDELVYRLLKMV